MNVDNYLTTREAAKLVGSTIKEIRSLAREGEIDGYRDEDGKWFIETKSLARYYGVKINKRSAKSSVTDIEAPDFDYFPKYKDIKKPFVRYVSGVELNNEVMGRIATAKKSVYITTGSLKKLQLTSTSNPNQKIQFLNYLDNKAKSGIDIRLIYSSESQTMREIMDMSEDGKGIELQQCFNNHSKIIIIDNTFLFVGSANITTAGLGQIDEESGNFESGIITNHKDLIATALEDFMRMYFPQEHCKKCKFLNGKTKKCSGIWTNPK